MSNGSCSVQGSLMCTKAINLSALYPNDTNRIDFKDTKCSCWDLRLTHQNSVCVVQELKDAIGCLYPISGSVVN